MTVRLRPVLPTDLPQLTGSDSPFDNFGPRADRTQVHDPSLNAELGGLAVVDDEGTLLGNVSWLWLRWGPNPQSRNPMIGIWLHQTARGRGVGTEAQRQLVELFFLHTTANRVEAITDIDNLAEQRALDKAGLKQEAILHGAWWRGGAYRDIAIHAVLRDTWLSTQATAHQG